MKKYLFLLISVLTLALVAFGSTTYAFSTEDKWTLADDDYYYLTGVNNDHVFDTSEVESINLQFRIKDAKTGTVIQDWKAIEVETDDVLETKVIAGHNNATTYLYLNDALVASAPNGLSGGRLLEVRYSLTAEPLPVDPIPVNPVDPNPTPITPDQHPVVEWFEGNLTYIVIGLFGLLGLIVVVKVLRKLF